MSQTKERLSGRITDSGTVVFMTLLVEFDKLSNEDKAAIRESAEDMAKGWMPHEAKLDAIEFARRKLFGLE